MTGDLRLRVRAIRLASALLLMLGSAELCLAQAASGPAGPLIGPMAGERGDGRMFAGHGGPFMGPPGRWWDDEGTAQQLGITADQRKKMDDIFSTNRPGLIDDVAAVQKAEAVLEPLFAADAPSEGAILAQIGKVAEARAELEKAHARMLLALRAQLTHDQWMKLQAMRPARHEGEGGWRGKGGRMDPDGPGGDTQGPPPGGKP